MSHGLETRVPLLDNEIMDLALSFGMDLLTNGVTGKIVFREAIRDWVPLVIVDKPKMGFGPPDASWYRGRLQPFIRRVLDPIRIARRGVFQPSFIANAIEDHMAKRANRLPLIWSMLSFEAWCESFNVLGGDLGEALHAISGFDVEDSVHRSSVNSFAVSGVERGGLALEVFASEGDHIVEGVLKSPDGRWFPILDGVPSVLDRRFATRPHGIRRTIRADRRSRGERSGRGYRASEDRRDVFAQMAALQKLRFAART